MTSQLEQAIVRAIHDGTAKCGIGFGKYPLGVLAVIEALVVVETTPAIDEALAAFRERLER